MICLSVSIINSTLRAVFLVDLYVLIIDNTLDRQKLNNSPSALEDEENMLRLLKLN